MTTKKTTEETKAPKKAAPKKVAPKKAAPEEASAEAEATVEVKAGSYIPAVGRRKTAIARVRLLKNGTGKITVNGKPFDAYFTTYELRTMVKAPLEVAGQTDAVDVIAKVLGGGIRGQAEAVRHGMSRALIVLNPTFRKSLKKLGFLMRDARKKERKKPGLKKARRAPQWSKR